MVKKAFKNLYTDKFSIYRPKKFDDGYGLSLIHI